MSDPRLNELADNSEQLRPFVSQLRQRTLQASELFGISSLSHGFLLRFLRARDFNVDLSLKVTSMNHSREKFFMLSS